MRRFVCVLLVAGLALAATEQAQGGWLGRIWHNFTQDFHRNRAWPEPFIYADRDAVRAPFHIMVAKGWKRQNTLNSHHFDAESGELTDAGKRKLNWICCKLKSM